MILWDLANLTSVMPGASFLANKLLVLLSLASLLEKVFSQDLSFTHGEHQKYWRMGGRAVNRGDTLWLKGMQGGREQWNGEHTKWQIKVEGFVNSVVNQEVKRGGISQKKAAISWVRTMPLISLARWLRSCGHLVSGEVPGNGTWSIREEQHSSPGSSSSPCAAAVHEAEFPLAAGAAAERGTFWLVDGLIYTDCLYQQVLLKGMLHAVETTLSFPFVS